MEWFKPVAELLGSHRVSDVLAGGTLRPGDPQPRFHVSMMDLYLALDGTDRLLRIACVNEYSDLEISVESEMRVDEVPGTGPPAACSVRRLLLARSDAPRAARSLRIIGGQEALRDAGRAACAALTLSDGDFLFLDPMTLHGIAPGGRDAYDEWIRRQVPWRLGLPSTGTLEEWEWTRESGELRMQRTF